MQSLDKRARLDPEPGNAKLSLLRTGVDRDPKTEPRLHSLTGNVTNTCISMLPYFKLGPGTILMALGSFH